MQPRMSTLPFLFTSLALAAASTSTDAQSWTTTTRVSVSSAGVEGNGASITRSDALVALSANGRFVAFNSSASNLVAGDTNGVPDIFVHDLLLGTTERVSGSSSGQQESGDGSGQGSYGVALSGDGRFVAFHSYSPNLVAGDSGNQCDVFVRDRLTGITTRASVAPSNKSPNGPSQFPALSADGHYVLFDSMASNLVSNDRNRQWDVFLQDRWTGALKRVSVSTSGQEGNAGSWRLSCGNAISADGRFVAFPSLATNLVPGDTNNGEDVFVRDTWANVTERVSVTTLGAPADGISKWSSLSADGRFVAFLSNAPNLRPAGAPAGNIMQVYVHDRVLRTTRCVSVSSTGVAADTGAAFAPALSADGRYVAFCSGSTNLVSGDTNGVVDVFVRDLALGTTTLVPGTRGGKWPAMDDTGAVIAFASLIGDLVPGDANAVQDVFAVR